MMVLVAHGRRICTPTQHGPEELNPLDEGSSVQEYNDKGSKYLHSTYTSPEVRIFEPL